MKVSLYTALGFAYFFALAMMTTDHIGKTHEPHPPMTVWEWVSVVFCLAFYALLFYVGGRKDSK